MNPLAFVSVALAQARQRAVRATLRTRICALNPTLQCDPTAIWNYPYARVDTITLGVDVKVMPYCEIVVVPASRFSAVPGRLVLEDGVHLATGVNVRAAGGTIHVGAGSGVGQHSVLIAANHRVVLGESYFKMPWDETRVGVTLGRNVWVGANCVLLPGTVIGDDALIAAGSVVTRDVPAGEIWGGVPARRLKAVPGPDDRPAPAGAGASASVP
jgi:acetyltransferase-like isoleucine patch superfamily enzyme